MTGVLGYLLEQIDAQQCAVSRAASPGLAVALARVAPVETIPVSGGRTVWEAAPPDAVLIVETPNGLGIAETLPAAGRRWTGIRRSPHVPAAPQLVDELCDSDLVSLARRLVHRLDSIRGVAPYHQTVVAPWLTVHATDPRHLEVEAPAIEVVVLGAEFPDIPGGVRIEIASGAVDGDIARYAARVEAATRGAMR